MPIAAEEARKGASHGTLVLAEEQTAGRGRRGRGFHSPAGENLYFTLILRLDQDRLRRLPLAVPLGVCQAVAALGVDAEIKWPNDIWVGGRKLSGMLIDVDGDVAYPGIGINVNGDPTRTPDLRDIATSIARELSHSVDRESLLAGICSELERAIGLSSEMLHSEYASRSMVLGRTVEVSPSGSGDPFEGTAAAIELDGTLVVRTAAGATVNVTAADVSVRPMG